MTVPSLHKGISQNGIELIVIIHVGNLQFAGKKEMFLGHRYSKSQTYSDITKLPFYTCTKQFKAVGAFLHHSWQQTYTKGRGHSLPCLYTNSLAKTSKSPNSQLKLQCQRCTGISLHAAMQSFSTASFNY